MTRYRTWKSVLDFFFALFLMILFFPIIVGLGILVRLTSPGPALFKQTRVGKDGKIFTLFKLRTMRIDAELNGAVWATKQDPRVTWLGAWLRDLHLDELPQLVNVMRGEMSLVGPRPERPEFVAVLAKEIPGYLIRLEVRPGVTGLAQVNLPPDTNLDSVRNKLKLDSEYIQNIYFSLDILLMFSTFLSMIGLRGAAINRTLGVSRNSFCFSGSDEGTKPEFSLTSHVDAWENEQGQVELGATIPEVFYAGHSH